jgi:hypothetical protein
MIREQASYTTQNKHVLRFVAALGQQSEPLCWYELNEHTHLNIKACKTPLHTC